MLPVSLFTELQGVLAHDPIDLARAALVIARVEQPSLDAAPSLDVLDRLGARAARRLERLRDRSAQGRVAALNALLFEDEGFAANRAHYDDFRNSLLNVVLERRRGIPITLALVYMEVARRAGVTINGIAFPGHFLLQVPDEQAGDDLILDPFGGGVALDDGDCRQLLARHLGDDAPFDPAYLRPCSARLMLARILNNLKRTYLGQRSFPHARLVTDLMLAVDPTMLWELRDRGLLAYHLDDFPAALRDLEDYRKLHAWADGADAAERDQVWEHIKTLKRRVASLN
jgi:regulator of sirC expression with transglutaminase-like and TPR domain